MAGPGPSSQMLQQTFSKICLRADGVESLGAARLAVERALPSLLGSLVPEVLYRGTFWVKRKPGRVVVELFAPLRLMIRLSHAFGPTGAVRIGGFTFWAFFKLQNHGDGCRVMRVVRAVDLPAGVSADFVRKNGVSPKGFQRNVREVLLPSGLRRDGAVEFIYTGSPAGLHQWLTSGLELILPSGERHTVRLHLISDLPVGDSWRVDFLAAAHQRPLTGEIASSDLQQVSEAGTAPAPALGAVPAAPVSARDAISARFSTLPVPAAAPAGAPSASGASIVEQKVSSSPSPPAGPALPRRQRPQGPLRVRQAPIADAAPPPPRRSERQLALRRAAVAGGDQQRPASTPGAPRLSAGPTPSRAAGGGAPTPSSGRRGAPRKKRPPRSPLPAGGGG